MCLRNASAIWSTAMKMSIFSSKLAASLVTVSISCSSCSTRSTASCRSFCATNRCSAWAIVSRIFASFSPSFFSLSKATLTSASKVVFMSAETSDFAFFCLSSSVCLASSSFFCASTALLPTPMHCDCILLESAAPSSMILAVSSSAAETRLSTSSTMAAISRRTVPAFCSLALRFAFRMVFTAASMRSCNAESTSLALSFAGPCNLFVCNFFIASAVFVVVALWLASATFASKSLKALPASSAVMLALSNKRASAFSTPSRRASAASTLAFASCTIAETFAFSS
mmetsp:Transcript_38101/g.89255  ORF Transcript_38101/g.89255 Transcript_38101/m.89255 type:complete len:285 (-) Transcript_38101:2792-3646(-)